MNTQTDLSRGFNARSLCKGREQALFKNQFGPAIKGLRCGPAVGPHIQVSGFESYPISGHELT